MEDNRTSNTCTRPWIQRKPQSFAFNYFIQLNISKPSLHADIEIFFVEFQNAFHVIKIKTDTSNWSYESLSFKTCPATKRN